MKNKITTKIIIGLIIFSFVLSFSPLYTEKTFAATSSISGLYSNPNTNNKTYKFNVKNVVNSQLLMSVVGCTGVVNRVADWMFTMVTSVFKLNQKVDDEKEKARKMLLNACAMIKAGVLTGLGSIPLLSDTTTGGKTTLDTWCKEHSNTTDNSLIDKAAEALKQQQQDSLRQQCFDGIAITLARNQLTAMTRSMMNWVNSGFGGNPFFVRNMQNLMTGIENNVIETGIDILLTPEIESPYARDFARTTIARRGIVSSSATFLGSLQSDLGSFITDPNSYYTQNQQNQAQDTRTAVEIARNANNAFSRDFMNGGWDGWLALTQRDQNNPLGFSMLTDQYFTETQIAATTTQKEKLGQNNGFLSQKKCVQWQLYNDDGTPQNAVTDPDHSPFKFLPLLQKKAPATCPEAAPDNCCYHWEDITPGSLIADKTKNYLTSPDRQAELVKTINDALNGLFSALLSKLEGSGLMGLSDQVENYSNWTDNLNSPSSSGSTSGVIADSASPYDNNGAYDGFNITRDLGNTYYRVSTLNLGDWNASTNVTLNDIHGSLAGQALNSDSGPIVNDAKGNTSPNTYSYYTVKTAGNTVLIKDGNNKWKVGDRAFWDGTVWQNWTLTQQSKSQGPIKTRGVIQAQYDYIDAATQILQVLPGVMPKLGELDYCLPGPNPNYEQNDSTINTQSSFQDWIDSSYVGPTDNTGHRVGVKIDGPGQRTYENYHEHFANDNSGTWNFLINNPPSTTITNNKGTYTVHHSFIGYIIDLFSWLDGIGGTNYHYDPSTAEQADIDKKTRIKEDMTNYVSSSLFANFFDTFGKLMKKMYYNHITQKFVQNELDPNSETNLDYVPMSQEGYDLTKDIMYYNQDNSDSIQKYKDGITQANTNIRKLENISSQVAAIIIAAQKRRETALEAQVSKFNAPAQQTCDAELDTCMSEYESQAICNPQHSQCINNFTASGNMISVNDYLTKFASCFSEQTQEFYDVGVLQSSIETGNCNDGIDNDLDGLVDAKDPDCAGVVNNNNGNNGNNNGTTTNPQVTYYYSLLKCSAPATPDSTRYQTSTTITQGTNLNPGNRILSGGGNNYVIMAVGTTSFCNQDIGSGSYGSTGMSCPTGTTTPAVAGNPNMCTNNNNGNNPPGPGTNTVVNLGQFTITLTVTGGTINNAFGLSGVVTFIAVPNVPGAVATLGGTCGTITKSTFPGTTLYSTPDITKDCSVTIAF